MKRLVLTFAILSALQYPTAALVNATQTDVFSYCKLVRNRDLIPDLTPPLRGDPGGRLSAAFRRSPRFTRIGRESIAPPFTSPGYMSTWRCMNGSVVACYEGATGSGCVKRRSESQVLEIIRPFCASYPNTGVPMSIQRYSASQWSCAGSMPIRLRTYPLDARGYLRNAWHRLAPPP